MNENNNKNNNQKYILTRETFGMTILLFSVIIFVMLLTRNYVFSSIGTAVCTFMYGTFGYGSFLVLALLAYLGVWLVWEKTIKISVKCALAVALSICLCFFLFHSVTTRNISTESFGTYLSLCYNNAANGFSGYTFGGVISAVVVYPIVKLMTFVGAYTVFGVLFAGSLYLSIVLIKDEIKGNKSPRKTGTKRNKKTKKSRSANASHSVQPETAAAEAPRGQVSYADPYGATENYQIVDNVPSPIYVNQPQQTYQQPSQNYQQQTGYQAQGGQPQSMTGGQYSSEDLGRKIIFEKGEFAAESYRRNMIFDENSYFNKPKKGNIGYMSSFGGNNTNGTKSTQNTYSENYRSSVENGNGSTPSSYVYGDRPVESLDDASLTEGVYNQDTVIQPETVNSVNQPRQEQAADENQNDASGYDFNSSASDNTEPVNSSEVNGADSYNELQTDFDIPSRRGENVVDPEQNDVDYSQNNSGVVGNRTRETANENPSIPEESNEINLPLNENPENTSENGGRSSNGLFGLFGADNPNLGSTPIEPDITRMDRGRRDRNVNLFDDEEVEGENVFDAPLNDRAVNSEANNGGEPEVIPERKRETVHITPPTREMVEAEAAPPKPKHVWKKYIAPSLDLLQNYNERGSVNDEEIEQNKSAIVETLANVRIESEIINVIIGPKFTRYDVRIRDNTAIKTALKHKDEIQIALRKDTINAYINFKLAALSIEVPNRESGTVGLKSILSSSQFLGSKAGSLAFALGKNIEGDCICPDITKMPHLLVAGTTGSGKSICLSSLIVSLLYRYGPDELRFILVDPKQVEFIPYENLPHLMINEIIFDVDKAIKALNWAIKEMERRYQLFKDLTAKGVATKDINEYNSHVPEGEEKLPKIVIILDEFGDLMLQAKKEIETRIVRLVQKARACGIHLILATQRPSVDCITGLIKSNLSTRIGFKVNSFADSSTIFDVGGAEKLLGSGDMYYRRSDRPELMRIQGCFISSTEVQRVTDFVKANNETYFDDSVSEFINSSDSSDDNSSSGSSDEAVVETDTKIDDTFIKALKYCVTSNQASVSMIQRRFPVGYIKACKIIDWMENMNYITQSEGSKPRKVLLSREEFINTYGEIDD